MVEAEVFELISGSDGRRIWAFDNHAAKVSISNFYTSQFIHDVDGDDVQDILTIHGGDPLRKPGANVSYAGRLILFSGATGHVITWSMVPDKMESYYSPQVYFDSHGEKVVLFGTGGETIGGALYVIKLDYFIRGHMQMARCLYKDSYKGVITPPVLLDITRDGVMDIVIATFNSTVLAINGDNYDMLWNFSIPMSETYSTPAPGFFNDDDIPDFLVIFNHGPTYPVYYYSEVTVLDGRTGQPLLEPFIRHSGGIQSSPLTVNVEGTAQDMFLYFSSDCLNHEGKSTKFSFTKTTLKSEINSDLCVLRFNTSSFSRLYAVSSITGSPGAIIYDSLSHTSEEYTHSVNTGLLAKAFLEKYPETAQYVIDRQKSKDDEKETDKSGELMTTTVDSADVLNNQKHGNKGDQTSESEDGILGSYGNNFLSSYEKESERLGSYYNIKTDTFTETPNEHSKHSKDHKVMQLIKEMRENGYSKLNVEGARNGDRTRQHSSDRHSEHHDRPKRHAGPHDSGGLQRLIATGTLAPSLSHDDHGIDLIFPVYWAYPSPTEILTEDEQKCVDRKMAAEGDRMNSNSKYFGMDHDAYDQVVEEECKGNNTDSMKITENILRMYPFNLHMGEMTVYRLHLSCQLIGFLINVDDNKI
ncbi:uncharacterized protein LOC117100699 [Anneissia japonica]|uniref:uncharacterized protein LOC117100699 n=1 Tax=Anneissia japonica TaxID=1529436 RepID=UPI0014259B22|nr:uncharacterized protein LOC117100699 [Anneissia japonica]